MVITFTFEMFYFLFYQFFQFLLLFAYKLLFRFLLKHLFKFIQMPQQLGIIHFTITIKFVILSMKESHCGRIVQQRKPTTQSRLIKQYDTSSKFYDIHYDRVNQLKNKYKSGVSDNVVNRSPFEDLTYVCNNKVSENDQIPLSVFTPRDKNEWQKKSKIKGHNLKQQYVRKVQLVNKGINNKLNSLEEELQLLKLQRQQKQNLQRIQQQEKIKEEQRRSRQQMRIQQQLRIQQQVRIQQLIRIQQLQKINTLELLKAEQQRQKQMELNHKQSHINIIEGSQVYNGIQRQIKHNQIIEQSQCRLMEEVKQGKVFSNEFRTLIHRIKNQISLDYQFTQLVLTIPRQSLFQIKESISCRHRFADLSFFQVSPMEMDPLQPISTQNVYDVSAVSQKLYQYYRKIDQHFQFKLHHKFSRDTVACLFSQIGATQITLGHLISYVNMQTGKQFRNRALVKLLRRMEICTHIIDADRFYSSLCI